MRSAALHAQRVANIARNLGVTTYVDGDDGRELTETETERYLADADVWWHAETLAELGQLGADWLEGKNLYLPAYGGATPDPETQPLIQTLAAANRAGYFTDTSQPGHGAVEGYDGRMWMQRAYVSGYADLNTAWVLKRAFAERPDLIFWCQPVKAASRKREPEIHHDFFPVTLRENDGTAETGLYDVNTVAGLAPTRAEVKDLYHGDIGAGAYRELRGAWHVTIADTEYEAHDRLWTALADWAAQRTHPHINIIRTGIEGA